MEDSEIEPLAINAYYIHATISKSSEKPISWHELPECDRQAWMACMRETTRTMLAKFGQAVIRLTVNGNLPPWVAPPAN